jgi:hypothetical protein
MAKTGKRQREGAGGGSRKKGGSSGQEHGADVGGAGLELPGACVSLLSPPYMRDVDCTTRAGRLREETNAGQRTVAHMADDDDALNDVSASCRRDAGVGRQVGLEAARRQ